MTLEDLVARCKASVTVTFNNHRDIYAEIANYVEDDDNRRLWSLPSDEEIRKIIAMDSIVEIHFYPRTPISFYVTIGATLDAALAEAERVLAEEEIVSEARRVLSSTGATREQVDEAILENEQRKS